MGNASVQSTGMVASRIQLTDRKPALCRAEILNMVSVGTMVPADTVPVAHQAFIESGRGQLGLLPSKASD